MSLRRLAVLLALALPLTFAASAHAYVYWGDPQAGTIGRANLDGTGATDPFIHVGGTPMAIAVNAGHIYWANQSGGTIGRADLDGTAIEPNFISGLHEPSGVAVTSSYIFWTSLEDSAVGRAKLDGSEKKPQLIAAGVTPCGIAVDSGSVYWSNLTGLEPYVGRASFTGGSATPKFARAEGAATICGLAVNSSTIFWTDTGFLTGNGSSIGTASVITGGSPRPSLIGDANGPCGIAILGTQVYWANKGNSTIARANTDGTAVNEDLVTVGGGEICGVAVDSLSAPPTPPPTNPPSSPDPTSTPTPTPPSLPLSGTVRWVKATDDTKLGTVKVSLQVNEAGVVSVTGKGIATVKRQAPGAATIAVTLRAAKRGRPALRRTGKLATKVTVSFTPSDGGTPVTVIRSVTVRQAGAA